MITLAVFHVIVGTALIALAVQTQLNRRKFRRLTAVDAPANGPLVSVLIPARNEAARIGGAVTSWVRQEYPRYEVLIYDDESTDATAERALAAAAGAAGVRVINGGPLPPGWRGKPHACHALRHAARGSILVFADADLRAAPCTIASAVHTLDRLGVSAFSAVPFHDSRSGSVRALLPLQNWVALTFVPWWCRGERARRLFVAVNGQFIVMRAATYDSVGGFAAVRRAIGEDAVLGRHLAARGYDVPLLDGSAVLRGEPFDTLGQFWTANVRSAFSALFGSVAGVLGAAAGLAAVYLAPIVILVVGLGVGQGGTWLWTWWPLLELALALVPRVQADRHFGYGARNALLHPLAIACLVAICVHSVVRFRIARSIEWRGRRYAAPAY